MREDNPLVLGVSRRRGIPRRGAKNDVRLFVITIPVTGADVEENFMQYLGRVFRRDDVLPIYIDLRDSMSTLVKH